MRYFVTLKPGLLQLQSLQSHGVGRLLDAFYVGEYIQWDKGHGHWQASQRSCFLSLAEAIIEYNCTWKNIDLLVVQVRCHLLRIRYSSPSLYARVIIKLPYNWCERMVLL